MLTASKRMRPRFEGNNVIMEREQYEMVKRGIRISWAVSAALMVLLIISAMGKRKR